MKRERKLEQRVFETIRKFIITDEDRLKGYIKTAKEIIKKHPECVFHCVKKSECKKLHAYEKKVEVLKELLQPRLDKDVKETRVMIIKLVRECKRQYYDIQKCIYIHKVRLTLENGYRMWEW